MPCSKRKVPLTTQHPIRLISVNYTVQVSQNPFSIPVLLLSHRKWWRLQSNGKVTHHQLNCPISHYHHHLSYASFISQPHCTSERTHRERIIAHTKNHCRKSTLLAPAWRLLSREYLMFAPCMTGPTPGQWQCFLLSPDEETVQTSQLCSYVPHADLVHP